MTQRREIDPNDPKALAFFKQVADLTPPTCHCRCGATFRSHCYTDYSDGAHRTQFKCPGCGSYSDIYKVSHDPEEFIIRTKR